MASVCVLYNPACCGGKGEEAARGTARFFPGDELIFRDIRGIRDYPAFFSALDPGMRVILCGGDGTLNRFINDTDGLRVAQPLFYQACGTGNDFLRDIKRTPDDGPVELAPYLKDLPYVTVGGRTLRFLNNVGFGIDGYCTEEGDRLRAAGKTNINYAGIAIKGLLGAFKPVTATVTVDGKTETFRKAWLAPTMKGRFYGGGMMAAPAQDRLDPRETLSVVLFYGKGKLKTLMAFPSIFQGEHIKHSDMVRILTGREITVRFDRPCPLQIDGETVSGVTEYHVCTASLRCARR